MFLNPPKTFFQDNDTNRIVVTVLTLSITNMMLPFNVSNYLDTTMIEYRELPDRSHKHRARFLTPTRCRPDLLQPEQYHDSAD